MPKMTVSELKRQCPYTSQGEYKRTTLAKPRLRAEIRRVHGRNWHAGKTFAEKRALFAEARASITKRFENEYASAKTRSQLEKIAAVQDSCTAGPNDPKCAICSDRRVQVAMNCTHVFCIECALKVPACPFCKQVHKGTYTLVSDNTIL